MIVLRVVADVAGLASASGTTSEASDPGLYVNVLGATLVPEPSTGLRIGLGLLGLVGSRRSA